MFDTFKKPEHIKPFTNYQQQHALEALAYCLTDCLLPTSVVDRPSFVNLVEVISQGAFKIPGRTKMTQVQSEQAQGMRERVSLIVPFGAFCRSQNHLPFRSAPLSLTLIFSSKPCWPRPTLCP